MRNVKADTFSNAAPTTEEIRQQIERVLSSDEFISPERGRRFLRFIVDETLAGRSQFLKAFTIANEIFGRATSFDAQNDPVVRIEAGRIRRALERYYLVAGNADGVVITIPKGGYVPHFEYMNARPLTLPSVQTAESADQAPRLPDPRLPRSRAMVPLALGAILLIVMAWFLFMLIGKFLASGTDTPGMSAASGPLVVVDTFGSDGAENSASDIAHGLRDEIISQLTKFDAVIVVADPSRASHSNATGYTLQGNVQLEGNRLRSAARLIRRSDATVIWANNYDADLRARSKLEIQAEIGQQIAIAVAQPYGAIFVADTDTIARQPVNGEEGAYACTLAYYSYRRSMNSRSHDTARDCLQQATERFPRSATSWALLSLTYLDEMRFRSKLGAPSTANPIELATRAAERAVAIAPDNARALQAVMLVSFFNNDIDKALQAGAAAYAVNANDIEVAGEYGLRLAMSGKWQSGCELVSTAVNKNAGPKGYYEVGMALCALMRNDIQAAELWSRMSDLGYNPMHHLVLLSILGAEGKIVEASQEKDWLNANAPELMENIRREVSLRLHRAEDQERFFLGLRAAGIAIQPVSIGRNEQQLSAEEHNEE